MLKGRRHASEFKLIDDKSRPGYCLYEDPKTGVRFWAREVSFDEMNKEPGIEYGYPTLQKLKLSGHLKGYKAKKFSELTEEEQKLFTEDDNIEE